MLWVILIILLIGCFVSSGVGKLICGAGVLAAGLACLGSLFDWEFMFTLAKICVAVIIIVIVGGILIALFGNKS